MKAKYKLKYGFFRNIVEAYEKDPDIINQKFGIRHETILHRAALHRRIEMVVFLLDHGAKQTGKIINLSIEFEKKRKVITMLTGSRSSPGQSQHSYQDS